MNEELITQARSGDISAQCTVGNAYRDSGNTAGAIEFYTMAAEQGDSTAQFNLALLYNNSGSRSEAIKWYTKAAESGDSDAQFNLALIFDKQDKHDEAIKWYTKAAEQGDESAQHNLALIYDDSDSKYYNQSLAIKWYAAAAKQGDAQSQYNLGLIYAEAKQYREAFTLFLSAAQQGYADSQYNVAYYYDTGTGTAVDKKKAAEWYGKAVKKGDHSAMTNLGIMYITGDGIPKNTIKGKILKLRGSAPEKIKKIGKIALALGAFCGVAAGREKLCIPICLGLVFLGITCLLQRKRMKLATLIATVIGSLGAYLVGEGVISGEFNPVLTIIGAVLIAAAFFFVKAAVKRREKWN